MRPGASLLLVAALGGFAATPLSALDPPHQFPTAINGPCNECHKLHKAPGGVLTSVAGNANLCLSCHVAGGQAAAKALADSDQALPAPGLPVGTSAAGTSHRWDSGVSGHATKDAANTSTGKVASGGAYTGRYPKTYTLTITTAGNVGSAQFSWAATTPPGGGGGPLTIAASATPGVSLPIALDDGVSVTFTDSGNPSFLASAKWYVYVRPDLTEPAATAMALRLESGKIMCSTCHDQHSQAREPFDPAAPAYGGAGTGNGRHFQRITNDTNQACTDCHTARNVTTVAGGSHPVAVSRSGGEYQNPTALPLDKTLGKVRCSTCHSVHYAAKTDGSLLRLASTKSLCTDCHLLADISATPGKHFVEGDTRTLWPGAAYGSTFPAVTGAANQGSCGNCHQAHGWPDTGNTAVDYPRLLVDREENLCYTCHDGAPVTKDVRAQIVKTYRHPAGDYSGRHTPGESAATAFASGATRHAECEDCHDPHQAKGDVATPTAPVASNRIRKVSGVQVTNGAGGTVPAYAFVTEATREYEICLKCHSSWTTQPAGQSNLAVDFNPNNLAYHPVEAAGRNTGINVNAFVNGWTDASTMYCTDCHSSDTTTVRGPHGSANRYILKKPYTASSASRTMQSTESCFDCHRYDTYANNNASNTIKGYSRFNPTASGGGFSRGHTYHVGSRGYPCYACHETHGLNRQHLIVTGRNPGLNSYTHAANGGTCSPTCHGSKTYTVGY